MIVRRKIGDVIQGFERHVAFAVNTEGTNTVGLAGKIATFYWPQLFEIGPHARRTVLSTRVGSKIFHAMFVHSATDNGWEGSPDDIEDCFNQLRLPTDQEVASVTMGAGVVGKLSGADPEANLAAMERSGASIVLYELSRQSQA